MIETALVVGDLQYDIGGYTKSLAHDVRAWKCVIEIGQQIKPTQIIFNGDMVDNTIYGQWRKFDLQTQTRAVKGFHRFIRPLRDLAPITYLAGNHEFRTNRYLADRDPARLVANMERGIDQFAIDYSLSDSINTFLGYQKEKQPYIKLGCLTICHGVYISLDAAKKTMLMFGDSVLVNHTHRLQTHYETKGMPEDVKVTVGVENGCLCKLTPEYLQTPAAANWQHGCSIVYYDAKLGWFSVHQIPIINGRYFLNGNRN